MKARDGRGRGAVKAAAVEYRHQERRGVYANCEVDRVGRDADGYSLDSGLSRGSGLI